MSKPFSVELRDVKTQIVDILNSSDLHIDIIRYLLTEILTTVTMQAEQTYADELISYKENQDGTN